MQAEAGEGAATGAGVGAAMGGIAGLLVGLGALAIPGIGPVLAAGPVIAALGGAGIGALTGGIIGALTDAGISESDANVYAEGVRRGGTLVTVHTTDDMANRAADVMNRHHPVDVERRMSEWRQTNWAGFDEGSEPFAFERDRVEREQMTTDARAQATGARSYGEYETGTSGQSTRPEQMDYTTYEPRFREHFQSRYGTQGGRWEDYSDSYRYGYDMGSNERYMNTEWDRVRDDLRGEWEMRHPDRPWDRYEDAVYQGWFSRREPR
jgi:hypothetical protein